MQERWPKILEAAKQDVLKAIDEVGRRPLETEEGNIIISKIEHLLHDLKHDANFFPIPQDGGLDIDDYNNTIRETPMSWQNAPWLYAECYMYRLLHTYFSTAQSPFWKTYDVFLNTKDGSFEDSRAGTVELITWYLSTLTKTEEAKDPATLAALAEEMLEISLWGNATDLSLLTTMTMADIQSRQGKASRTALKKNVIVDDTEQVWQLLQKMRSSPAPEVHVVLDNSGFELLADLVLATYLIAGGYAKKVILHGKGMPWFVSDVTARDLKHFIQCLGNPSSFGKLEPDEAANLRKFGSILQLQSDNGQLCFEAHHFWTSQYSFDYISTKAPDLYEKLCGGELVIFKGDLNYRKLVADKAWPKSTPFKNALGGLGLPYNGTGMRVLALRTCKADVCVGLKEGQEEKLNEESQGEWIRNGRYAVISFCNVRAN